jgi:peptidase M28-like protein
VDRSFPWGRLLLLVAVGLLACESPKKASEPASTDAAAELPPPPLGVFSATRVSADLAALAKQPSNDALRSYVASQLATTGLSIQTVETPGVQGAGAGVGEAKTWKHVIATAPGASPDLFVLVARLDEARGTLSGAALEDDLSGAALLLETARFLSTRSLPYTTRFVWLEGDVLPRAEETGARPELGGSESLAARMSESGELSKVRLLVVFDRICRDDLHVARDLGSHRIYREDFFNTGARAGWIQVFPRNQEYETVEASHLAFRNAGVRSVVVLSASGALASEGHTCAPQSVEAVGTVALDTLDTIGRRLAKIDRFSKAPLAATAESARPAPVGPAEPPAAPTTPSGTSHP